MHVAVLGAGLQGACVALELASRGIRVDLFDKNDRTLAQASARNEGKIHLGFVYAADPSLRTARIMVRGALAFAPLLRRWIGGALDAVPVSVPFRYAVHAESQLGADEIERYFHDVHAIGLEEGGSEPREYFGRDYRVAPARLSPERSASLFSERSVSAAFETEEVAIDPESLAAAVRTRVAGDAAIRCRLRSTVRAAEPGGDHVDVVADTPDGRVRERYDHVVNALWDGRLAVDATAGVHPEQPWLYRVKHYLRIRVRPGTPPVPSATVILGPFGDLVAYGDRTHYVSWYPAGVRGVSSALSPPDWPLELEPLAAATLRDAILTGLGGVVPALQGFAGEAIESCHVQAGIIMAWGESDIYDRASGLHARYAIGPRSHGRYHTIETGKLTMAPLFASALAARIAEAT
ncbi:MAG TPA: FAD-dependent oxidoreductase [Candidatus Elarobacter sp.]